VQPFFTRGILRDLLALTGGERLPMGDVITVDDSNQALAKPHGKAPGEGAVVLVHTGQIPRWKKDNETQDLEELAQDSVYEVAWSLNPLPRVRTPGSPGNSVAMALLPSAFSFDAPVTMATLPSLRLLRGSRPATLVGLYMDLVSSPQLLEKHEVIPAFDPHAGPNGQAHFAPVSQRQHNRAFA